MKEIEIVSNFCQYKISNTFSYCKNYKVWSLYHFMLQNFEYLLGGAL